MSLAQVLAELPAFSVAERQLLIRRALEIDEPSLAPEEEKLIAFRLDDHRRDPSSTVSFDDMRSALGHRRVSFSAGSPAASMK